MQSSAFEVNVDEAWQELIWGNKRAETLSFWEERSGSLSIWIQDELHLYLRGERMILVKESVIATGLANCLPIIDLLL